MKELYDVGYLELRDPNLLKNFVEATGAIVLDIRFSPRSRDAKWSGTELEKMFKEGHYYHLKDLGNKNYRGAADAPVELVNQESGFNLLEACLETHPAILMCACWERRACHRHVALKAFEARTGVVSIPLTRKLAHEMIDTGKPQQLDIFSIPEGE